MVHESSVWIWKTLKPFLRKAIEKTWLTLVAPIASVRTSDELRSHEARRLCLGNWGVRYPTIGSQSVLIAWIEAYNGLYCVTASFGVSTESVQYAIGLEQRARFGRAIHLYITPTRAPWQNPARASNTLRRRSPGLNAMSSSSPTASAAQPMSSTSYTYLHQTSPPNRPTNCSRNSTRTSKSSLPTPLSSVHPPSHPLAISRTQCSPQS